MVINCLKSNASRDSPALSFYANQQTLSTRDVQNFDIDSSRINKKILIKIIN